MKNDFRGKQDGEPVTISVPPTLLMTAVAKVSERALRAHGGFQGAGDVIYLAGRSSLGLAGSELSGARSSDGRTLPRSTNAALGRAGLGSRAHGSTAGSAARSGKRRPSFARCTMFRRAALLVAVAEGLLARGFGAQIDIPRGLRSPGSSAFGEGFTRSSPRSPKRMRPASRRSARIWEFRFVRIGTVDARSDRLEVTSAGEAQSWSAPTSRSFGRPGRKAGTGNEPASKPRALVITGDGINCENETAQAFRLAGFEAEIRHLNDLIAEQIDLDDLSKRYSALALPGRIFLRRRSDFGKSARAQDPAPAHMESRRFRRARRAGHRDLQRLSGADPHGSFRQGRFDHAQLARQIHRSLDQGRRRRARAASGSRAWARWISRSGMARAAS